MGTINLINGGLDVQGIVDNLIAVDSVPITRMQSQTKTLQSKISAFQSINTKLASLLNNLNSIMFKGETVPLAAPGTYADRLEHSVFSALKTSSSDEGVVTATASKGNASGNYAITVTGLAHARSLASDNFADTTTTETGTGTLVLTIGTGSPVTLTIDDTNNTLEGVRQAINSAKAGVTATIVNDGTSSPYRLLLTSDKSGTANAVSIQDNLTGGKALNLTQKVAASNADFVINGVAISKASNTISDVIDGVSFTLHDLSSTTVNLVVERDVDTIVGALRDLASAYNEVNASINAQSRYNTDTKTAGLLSGDSALRGIQSKIQLLLTQSVSNDLTSYRVVSQVGFQFNSDGTITVNETTLRDAINDDFTGVAALFLGDGAITDSRVSYNSQTTATQAGTYSVAVTALAQQANATGQQTITTLTQDERLTVTHGALTASVDLLNGDSLSSVLEKINSALSNEGITASAANDGSERIRITTSAYGSSESITVVSNRANGAGSTGFGTTPVTATGTNITGTINGNAAVGSGLVLTGASGRPEEGLSLTISQSTTGSYGSIRVSAGQTLADGNSPIVNLRSALKNITDPLTGPIHHSTDALNSNIRRLSDQISDYQERLDVERELLVLEYSKASEALQQMQVLQNSITSQTASLASIK